LWGGHLCDCGRLCLQIRSQYIFLQHSLMMSIGLSPRTRHYPRLHRNTSTSEPIWLLEVW
jgi:hypothetical protein